MLKGRTIDLEIAEKGDLATIKEWMNDVEFVGDFESFDQSSLGDMERQYDQKGEAQWYFVQKKDGTRIGYISHFKSKGTIAVGYMFVRGERGKGYGTEAVQIMVDYIFLHKDTVRVQAETHPDNVASQRVLEKAGFKFEGRIRKSFFSRGVYRDTAMYSILREEWKAPKVLPLGHTGA